MTYNLISHRHVTGCKDRAVAELFQTGIVNKLRHFFRITGRPDFEYVVVLF